MEKTLRVRLEALRGSIRKIESTVGTSLELKERTIRGLINTDSVLEELEHHEECVKGDLESLIKDMTKKAEMIDKLDDFEIELVIKNTFFGVINYVKFVQIVIYGYEHDLLTKEGYLSQAELAISKAIKLLNYNLNYKEILNKRGENKNMNNQIAVRKEALKKVLEIVRNEVGISINISSMESRKYDNKNVLVNELVNIRKGIEDIALMFSDNLTKKSAQETYIKAVRHNIHFIALVIYGVEKEILSPDEDKFIGFAEAKVDSTLKLTKSISAYYKELEKEQSNNQEIKEDKGMEVMNQSTKTKGELVMESMPKNNDGNYVLTPQALAKLLEAVTVEQPQQAIEQPQAEVDSISDINLDIKPAEMSDEEFARIKELSQIMNKLESQIKMANAMDSNDVYGEKMYKQYLEEFNKLTGKNISTKISNAMTSVGNYVSNKIAPTVDNVVSETGNYIEDLINEFLDTVKEVKDEAIAPIISSTFDGTIATGKAITSLTSNSIKRTGKFASNQIDNLTGLIK